MTYLLLCELDRPSLTLKLLFITGCSHKYISMYFDVLFSKGYFKSLVVQLIILSLWMLCKKMCAVSRRTSTAGWMFIHFLPLCPSCQWPSMPCASASAACSMHCALCSVHCALCTVRCTHFASAVVCTWEYFEIWANCSLQLPCHVHLNCAKCTLFICISVHVGILWDLGKLFTGAGTLRGLLQHTSKMNCWGWANP